MKWLYTLGIFAASFFISLRTMKYFFAVVSSGKDYCSE
jgi:hypothetical protein